MKSLLLTTLARREEKEKKFGEEEEEVAEQTKASVRDRKGEKRSQLLENYHAKLVSRMQECYWKKEKLLWKILRMRLTLVKTNQAGVLSSGRRL